MDIDSEYAKFMSELVRKLNYRACILMFRILLRESGARENYF